MLRPVDTLLLAVGRFRPWARERMVYRALVVLALAGRRYLDGSCAQSGILERGFPDARKSKGPEARPLSRPRSLVTSSR
jgi:hypothetical protein